MKKILYINGNPQQENDSFSRRTGAYYLEQLNKSDVQVEIFNVYEEEVPLIDEEVLAAWGALGSGTDFGELSQDQQAKVGRMGQILAQFKEADAYVFVSPMWNFSITPKLKAYIDNIVIAGETFNYTENGPVGALKNKKAIVVQASGGVYSEGPMTAFNHNSSYIEKVLNLIGVTDTKVVYAEGVALPNLEAEEVLSSAYKQVDDLFDLDLV